MARVRFVSALLLVTAAPYAWACFTLSPEQTSDVETLVAKADGIYIARAVDYKVAANWRGKTRATFTLEVKKVLKGKAIERVSVVAEPLTQPEFSDFKGHTDKEFWAPAGGTSGSLPDCTLYPKLVKGREYLVFPGMNHKKAFEPIGKDTDALLAKVENLLKGKARGR